MSFIDPGTVHPLYQLSVAPLTAPMYVVSSKNPSALYIAGTAVTVAPLSADPLTTPLSVFT